MTHFTPLLLVASLLALCSAAPYFPKFPTDNSGRARSTGFSVSWSPGEKTARSAGFGITWSPGEKALLQWFTVSWKNKEKALLQSLLDNLSENEKATLQRITVSWKAQQKAFLQGLLEELNNDEKAALQRISISFGERQKAGLQQFAPDFSDLYRILGQPTNPGEAKTENIRYPIISPRDFGKANAERLGATDILSLVSDLSSMWLTI